MALGFAQPLTEYQKIFLGVKAHPARKADNFTAMWDPRHLTTLQASTACYRNSFTLPGLEFRPFGRPTRSQSLYQLTYSD
jgi:hypothetical protein